MKDPLASACITCPAGFYCVNDKSQDPEPCPPGYYCPNGTGFDWRPCPKGSYGDKAGLANETSALEKMWGSIGGVARLREQPQF